MKKVVFILLVFSLLKTNSNAQGSYPDFTAAAEKTIHSVVYIKTEYTQKTNTYDDFFGDPFFNYFSPYQYGNNQPIVGAGSGVIISNDGFIVTNNHVVQDADKITVTLNDKRSYEAVLIGNDPNSDLALIKINVNNLPEITFGNSDNVKIGEWVLAVGNPFNLSSTVTAGIVSAKARNINILGKKSGIDSFIQTDAAVNPGNSGGALVNINGDLIGINAAIATNTGSYTGYSFAIPVNIVKKIVEDIMQYGEVQRAYMGITFVDMDGDFVKKMGIKDMKGVYIESVTENGPAFKSGVKAGDIILKINGAAVNTKSELMEVMATHRPGDIVKLKLLSDNKELDKEIILENKNGNIEIIKTSPETAIGSLGADFKAVSKEEMVKLNLKNGVKVVRLEQGKLWNAGIKEGFIILFVDKKPVKTVEDVTSYLSVKKGGVLIEGIYPNGMRAYYGFGM
jgi:Do/DeqQ family serine protease